MLLMSDVAAATQSAAPPPPALALTCDAGPLAAGAEEPNLHGQWDFVMVPMGQPSFGLMTIGFVGAEYGGSLAPTRTAPVVMRSLVLNGHSVRMVVAGREGDVRFDARVSAKGDIMCGTVTYIRGEVFPMIAHKRPMTYQSPARAGRR
jgi:hypothetical protein